VSSRRILCRAEWPIKRDSAQGESGDAMRCCAALAAELDHDIPPCNETAADVDAVCTRLAAPYFAH